MSKITIEEVKYIASLAHINMKQEELEKMTKEIVTILDSIAQISCVAKYKNTSKPFSLSRCNVLREDLINHESMLTQKEVLKSAPDKESNFFKIPSILDSETK